MELLLIRHYTPNGVNGRLLHNGYTLCFTIELPWLGNRPNHSCIPEGTYTLVQRHSVRWGLHLLVNGVVGRSLILFHPANNALQQLRGCIAPVSSLIRPGIGGGSCAALSRLNALVFPALEQRETVFLTIISEDYARNNR